MAFGECGEGLECALQNALCADVDPTAGGHLAVHHEALTVELVKVVPVSPFADEVGVGDDDAGRHVVGREDADGLAGLDQQRFLVAEVLELVNDGVETLPVPGRLADAAVDDEILRALGDFGIEVVHQAAEGRFLLPAFAVELGAARGANRRSHRSCHGLTCLRDYSPHSRYSAGFPGANPAEPGLALPLTC